MILVGLVVMTRAVVMARATMLEPRWAVLCLLTLAGAVATIRLRAAPISFSISDTFTFTTLLLIGPAAATITASVEGLVLSCLLSPNQRRVTRTLFNMSAIAFAMWMAGLVLHALNHAGPLAVLGGRWQLAIATAGAIGTYFLTNTWIVATAIALDQDETVLGAWREHFLRLGVNYFAGGYIALLLALFAPALDMLTFLLMAPLPLVLYASLRTWVGRINDRVAHLDSMNQQRRATIEALAHAIDAKDQVTHGHIRRVQAQSLALARALGCRNESELSAIETAGLLHDLGKLGIPEHILNKPGRLTSAEYTTIKKHSAIGADILADVGFPYPVVPIVRHHHENWDGTGYPDGLAGEQIPFGARVLAVVDCFDALTSARPYRPAMSADDALTVIRDRRGTMYDPSIVDAFLAAVPVVGRPVSTADEAPIRLPASASLRADNERCLRAGDYPEFSLRPDAALAIASGTLGAAAGVVFTYVEETDAIAPVASMGLDAQSVRGLHMRLGERLSGWVGAARRVQHDTDGRLDLPSNGLLRAAVSVPIVRGDALLGVITMYGHTPGSLAAEKLDGLAAAMAAVRTRPLAVAPAALAVHSGDRGPMSPRDRAGTTN